MATRLLPTQVNLEANLESWIEQDPALVQGGLIIVGRQVATEGGPLDLLAVDPEGRWVVIEIKREYVRRETVAQALDYASCISEMPTAELREKVMTYLRDRKTTLGVDALEEDEPGRRVTIIVVGTGREPGLERMIRHLGNYQVPIRVVSFQVFQPPEGDPILVRELTDADVVQNTGRHEGNLLALRARAEQGGAGPVFDLLVDCARRHGFHPIPYKHVVMVAPPQNRGRMLFTFKAQPSKEHQLPVYVYPRVFSEFFAVAPQSAERLGRDGWTKMSMTDAQRFVRTIDELVAPKE